MVKKLSKCEHGSFEVVIEKGASLYVCVFCKRVVGGSARSCEIDPN